MGTWNPGPGPTAGNDVYQGDGLVDNVGGLGGHDALYGFGGNDFLRGEGGNDTLVGGDDADSLYGGDQNDVIDGGAGVDDLQGGNHDDRLYGGAAGDWLSAGDGVDELYGGAGIDSLIFGAFFGAGDIADGGEDGGYLSLQGNYADLVLSSPSARNLLGIQLGAGFDYTIAIAADFVPFQVNYLQVFGDNLSASDVLNFDGSLSSGISFDINGGAANDDLTGGALADDFILLRGGSDTVDGGGGDDVFHLWATFDAGDRLNGGAGNDRANLNGDYSAGITIDAGMLVSVEHLSLTEGYDYTIVIANDAFVGVATPLVTLFGVADVLHFDARAELDSAWFVIGGAGADTLRGGAGNDTLAGAEGANVIEGGLGDDSMSSSGGGSTYDYNARNFGLDHIQDFAAGDRVDVADLRIGDFETLSAFLSSVSHDLQTEHVLSLMYNGVQERITLYSTLTTLDEAAFVFDTATSGQSLNGFALDDVLLGGLGSDFLNGLAGNDSLAGGAGNDSLNGGDGEDVLYGNRGNDTLTGDLGFDTFSYIARDFGQDNITDFSTLFERIDLSALNIASYGVLTHFMRQDGGDAVIEFMWNGVAESISIDGRFLENFTANNFVFNTSTEAMGAYGGSARDVLFTANGADVLNGGGGDDVMAGGGGHDIYYVDTSADRVIELAGQGSDWVYASATYTLADYVEVLTLTGDAAINGTGNALANEIYGNAANNALYGRAGADRLWAAAGSDALYGGDGDDALAGEADNDTLDGGNHNDALEGGDGGDVLYGRGGNDILDGGAGADHMFGGAGDDTYFIDHWGDIVADVAGGGTDLVYSYAVHSLGAFFENLTLLGWFAIDGTGNVLANRITGNASANTLSGLAGADTLVGGDGDDILNGGAGNDLLEGGVGADTLDGGNDVDELSGGDGADSLYGRSGADLFRGDAGSDWIYGGDGDDVAYGVDGDDVIDGGNHNDTMSGQVGGDTLYGRQGDDTSFGGEGADTIYGGDGVDWMSGDEGDDLLDGGNGNDVLIGGDGGDTLYGRQDTDSLDGQGGSDSIYGGDGGDFILGGDGDDYIDAGNGDDYLNGGAGADTLVGGAGVDQFVFMDALGDIDTVVNFNAGDDTFYLERTIFTGLDAGELSAGAFVVGAAALDADDRIIYDPATGALYYDADGDGAGVAVQFATLGPGLTLTAANFVGVG